MTDLLSLITKIFFVEEVRNIALVFGATVMSPKFTILLSFPYLHHDGPILDIKHCLAEAFRKIFQIDRQQFSLISKRPTKMSVFFNAKKTDSFETMGLQPRPLFKIQNSNSKKLLQINLLCKTAILSPMRSCEAGSDSYISGISPLDDTLQLMALCEDYEQNSNCDIDDNLPNHDIVCGETNSNLSQSKNDCSVTDYITCEEFVWYLAPIQICGFK